MRRRAVLAGLAGFGAAPGFGGPFALTGGDGATVTDASLRGKFVLLFFGYTNCPDVCPTTLQTMALALRALGAPERLRVLFVTVDPADTPAVVARYAALFSPAITGLSGNAAALAQAEADFHVFVARGADGAISHSDLLYLIGPDGGFLTAWPADISPAALAAGLNQFLS